MLCVEFVDSIVQCGCFIFECVIYLVNMIKWWDVWVVYGDMDR